MDKKSTPGPWVASQILDDGRWGIVTDHPRKEVFDQGDIIIGVRDSLTEADAHLIAAAPELYEAGKRMAEAARSWHDFHHGSEDVECDDICEALPALEAAIEKVEGKKEPSRHDAHLGATES